MSPQFTRHAGLGGLILRRRFALQLHGKAPALRRLLGFIVGQHNEKAQMLARVGVDAEIMHVFQEGRLKSFRRPELSSARNVAVCAAAAKGGRKIVAPALRV